MGSSANVRTGDLAIRSDHVAGQKASDGLLAAGGVIAALGASSCCVLPFLLFTLGVSGAWIGNLTALAPYQPLFLAAALGLIALGFARAYRSRPGCSDGSFCSQPRPSRIVRLGLWAAAVLVVAAAIFPYVARIFLEA